MRTNEEEVWVNGVGWSIDPRAIWEWKRQLIYTQLIYRGCRALKTFLVSYMLRITPAFMKVQCWWVSSSICSYSKASSSKDNSGNSSKGFWHSLPASCQSHHPPCRAGQPWPWRCVEWQHQKVLSRFWQHDQKCKPLPVLPSGPCPSSSWRIA